MNKQIFSGENSRSLWDEINSINNLSVGDDIHCVLYSLGCALQKLESKVDAQLEDLVCED